MYTNLTISPVGLTSEQTYIRLASEEPEDQQAIVRIDLQHAHPYFKHFLFIVLTRTALGKSLGFLKW